MKRFLISLPAIVPLAILGLSVGPVRASHETVVTLSGDVTLAPGLTLQVGAHASGPAHALSGQGFDSPFRGNPFGSPPPPGYCRFAARPSNSIRRYTALAY